jgi:peptidoglycan hydrolase-like protein with peptidoglycan-binding domain
MTTELEKTLVLPTLSEGDTGPDVRWAQYLMVRQTLSYTDVDGVFGPVTKRAVIEFQYSEGLYMDGIIGPATWEALEGDRARPPILQLGSHGVVVARIQHAMNLGRGSFAPPDAAKLAEDGKYGPRTESAVRAMQAYNRIAADGVVGEATWAIPIGAAGQVVANLCAVPGPG